MDELLERIVQFKQRLETIQASLHLDRAEQRLVELHELMAQADFWEDRGRAQALSQEASDLEQWISFWKKMSTETDDILKLAAEDKGDQAVNLRTEIAAELARLEAELAAKEVETWLDEPYDRAPAIMTIYSGAGGVDAQDWAQMLERMYLRFSALQDWKVTILQRTPGQEAGIKNVTMKIEGAFAYGYLRVDSGVHRLVRISPYDADQSRHTSFAMVEILPELEEAQTIVVDKDDVRVDVFRSSGHGGQSVNTTDSAVRLTHIPTGITTSCQNERSQMQNKAQAWKMLMGKLEKYYAAQAEEERQLLRGEFTEAAWGNQIRSYVLHPYTMVKDHRTKYESKDPEAVLNGDLMPFIEAALRKAAADKYGKAL